DIDGRGGVRMWSRLGNEKTNQFPEIAAALETWARQRKPPRALVLDGEIVAVDSNGDPTGFQQLQGRIHVLDAQSSRPSSPSRSRPSSPSSPSSPSRPSRPSRPSVAFIAFDILREGGTDLRNRPLLERRAILERVFSSATGGRVSVRRTETRPPTPAAILRISEMTQGDGRQMYQRALASGWE